MQDELILQLLPMLMAGLALLIAMGKAWVGRIEAQTEQEATATQIGQYGQPMGKSTTSYSMGQMHQI